MVTHGSSDRRSWLALQNLVTVARAKCDRHINRHISGGCLEGQTLSLAQQLAQFANEVIQGGGSEIVILPLFLLEEFMLAKIFPQK